MPSSISHSVANTAVRDYSVSVLLFLFFMVIFYFYSTWRTRKATANLKRKPKCYFMIFLLSLMAMMSIAIVTECIELTIYRYGISCYYPYNYFPLIVFIVSFISMIAIAAYIREKQKYTNSAFTIMLAALGVLIYSVYQLRETAYPLRNAEIVKTYVTQIFNSSVIAKLPLAVLNKEPRILKQIQAKAIDVIYDRSEINITKYGLDGKNFALFSRISYYFFNKNARLYYSHATDSDAITAFRIYTEIYNNIANKYNCALDVPEYLLTIKDDVHAEKLRRKYIDSMVTLIENSDLNRPIQHPTYERFRALVLKTAPPELTANEEANAKLSGKQQCLASVAIYNSLLKLPDSELAEAARFILTGDEDNQ